MPQVTKEQVSLQQGSRKPAFSLFPLLPSCGQASLVSQQSHSREGSQVTVAPPWSFCHQRSFQHPHAGLSHRRQGGPLWAVQPPSWSWCG